MPLSILVATDLSPRSDRAVDRAFDIASTHEGRVTLLHVSDDSLPDDVARTLRDTARDKLASVAASRDGADRVAHEERAVIGDTCPTIMETARDLDVDLVILGMHRPRPFLDMFLETTMERTVRGLSGPVLLVRDPVDHPYRTVLSAMDFSPAATTALNLAATTLAPDAALHALHAVHIPYRGFMSVGGSAQTTAPFLKAAEHAHARWRRRNDIPDRLGPVEIVEGSVHALLADRVSSLRPDLLCVGAHGRSGAAPALLGSLANDLMRAPPCDLLIGR